VALSLCGPLDHEDTVFSDERFNQALVTQDVLMENPNVLSDPNLVVKIDGRYSALSIDFIYIIHGGHGQT